MINFAVNYHIILTTKIIFTDQLMFCYLTYFTVN